MSDNKSSESSGTAANPVSWCRPFVESQRKSDPKALRSQLEEDGYLFLRGMLDTNMLLDLRRQVLQICSDHGWLIDGSEMMQGRCRRGAFNGAFSQTGAYQKVQSLHDFHALAHTPDICDLLTAVIGEEVLPHPRNILRVTLPGSTKITTPPHQDYPLIQGTPRFYTVWLPLGECPLALGGLGIARGSHHRGPLPIRPSEGAGGVAVDINETELEWVASDFELGDVLIFSGLTVHRAFNNATEDLMRLSCDFRYQAITEPIAWNSLEPHQRLMDWAEVYAEWDDQEYAYYWQRYALNVAPSVPPFELENH